MTDNPHCDTAWDRPYKEHPCGCVFYPPFTVVGDGPRQWQSGTHYEAWTDTSECREGHDYFE